jgi:hypothetical protein
MGFYAPLQIWKGRMTHECQPRSRATPAECDVDAMQILMLAMKAMIQAKGQVSKSLTLDKVFSISELDGIMVLNHAFAYLEDRSGYPLLRVRLYNGIIEVR